jgi:hypothetical protein
MKTPAVVLAALLLGATAQAQQTASPDLLQSPQQAPQQAPVQQQWMQDNRSPRQMAPGEAPTEQQGSDQGSASDNGQSDGSQPDSAQPDTGQPDSGQPDSGQSAGEPPTVPGPPTFSRPNVWVQATTARLQALDKVNAQSSNLTIKVGQSATYGSLTITVKACVVRPTDQPADAAAFLDVKDSHPDSGNFAGWMLANEPDVSMLQNPIYDLRVTGCS